MEWKYTTQSGDVADVLAFDFYGSERLAYVIQQANPHILSEVFLKSGVELTIPQLPIAKTNNPRPPWAR